MPTTVPERAASGHTRLEREPKQRQPVVWALWCCALSHPYFWTVAESVDEKKIEHHRYITIINGDGMTRSSFQEQKSLVQEVIEAAGHLCIFLPKFHCELNFIEFFWGAVKRYLRENCDYSFTTLQENMPNALASVSVEIIRKWEHRMKQWMEAYGDGLGAKDAQIQVKKFSSKCYMSHRRIPEHVAAALDA
ncbi:hypothetical protein L208DRAFT_1388659 [Tricholoma matsutake]|nr:hypothetical protein L208DRAFT_1388659 [Tricholoma matsutake 945]